MSSTSLQFLVVLSVCVVFCVALPLSSKQDEDTARLLKKLFPASETRTTEDSWFDHSFRRLPLEQRTSTNDQVLEQRLKKELLRDILEMEKRRLEQAEAEQTTNEKREPQRRCLAGQWFNCKGKQDTSDETERRTEDSALRGPAPAHLADVELEKIKQYDMELERALQRLQFQGAGDQHRQM
ncbi:PREDICTED: uncharacterized protein LOC107356067 isoform X2 [Acropora digitifera]|uniref:uncharacterized protein LOC107356067 isoform X2 n=1 Tax=Acropora digitifera TaxID=70779 RepID=UPI000779F34D|nr:PREDICTED: uncharacterized protein LOC107356067 isoform X2 [Acropora digitifera]